MNRFISIIAIIICMQHVVQHLTASSVLVEAESFQHKGGWVLDQQFAFQMGSPYLLAHGMGKQVENAKTVIEFPSSGKYHVWVRTMNWAPGDWEAPGKFRLLIDQVELNEDLGTVQGWSWQYAGTVNLKNKQARVELKDLTGFEGRCDAIYFSKKKATPPDDFEELRSWRQKQQMTNADEINIKQVDLVVVGGGTAGCAAAIAAAEKGLTVALIHDRPVLGGNASAEIRVHTLGVKGNFARIINMIDTKHYPNGSAESLLDDEKRMKNIRKYPGIQLYLNWQAFDVTTKEDKIECVFARHTSSGEVMQFVAPLFADCTGDAWIGYWAGAEYMYGRESESTFQEGVSSPEGMRIHFNKSILEKWEEYKNIVWSPLTKDNRVMGASVLWNSAVKDADVTFPEVPWAMDVAGNHQAINGEWYWEFSDDKVNQIEDAEKIRDHLFKAIYGAFYNAKKLPENSRVNLEWVSYLVGKRESRRLTGDYIYTFNDVRNNTSFEDAVVFETRSVDVHHQQVLLDKNQPDFISDAIYYKTSYHIPYRCLYSINIKNLFMAGRNFSCSHLGLGGPRVMNTTAQMGCVVGYAASLCFENNVFPRDVYQNYLNQLLEMIKQSNTKVEEEMH